MQAEVAVHLFEIFATDRATSYQRARRPVQGFKTNWAQQYRTRQAFHALLNKLKRGGFIAQREKRKGALWHITPSGARRLARIKEKSVGSVALPPPHYTQEGNKTIVIIAFDVPEKERRKRQWLRDALHSLGFEKVQQSVWIGKRSIPAEFVRDLKEYSLLPYVQIFAVSSGGTLKQTY
ncbi:MAG: CRISPR-associated endonuclease Cas2 [Candidatus Sungbacteria bacterium RIFCSPLOWO2_02_FULL_54_10]|nr:MAG: CRISPR-associated endonuclease Cas2 [Candidatus Sungbacteria bacterium RIFCSPLOWO2_02_FULL_54_10]